MTVTTESRTALRELIAVLEEVDQRWAGPEWNLHSPADVVAAHRALMHILEGGLVGMFEFDAGRPQFRRIVTPSRELSLKRGQLLLDVAIDELAHQRLLVRKVLVERSDRHPRRVRDRVGGQTIVAMADQNPSSRREDGVDRGLAAGLARAFPGRGLDLAVHRTLLMAGSERELAM